MEFRITLNLHNFFNDFRSSSRLFITKKIKTIQNLREHISEIFQINTDFYLVANNVYLPNAENVRILKEDETISAIPYTTRISHSVALSTFETAKLSNHEVADTSNIEPSEDQEYENKERSKRKRKIVQECCSNTSALMFTTLEKKQKKKNMKSEDINEAEPENLLEAKKKKKFVDGQKEPKKASKHETVTKDHDYFAFAAKPKTSVVQNGQHSQPSDDSDDDKAESSKNTSIKNFNPFSELCRNKKKPVEFMLISSKPKLVKPIKVYDKLQALPRAESLNNSITVVDSNQNNITVKHTHSGEQNENNANTKCSEIKIIGPTIENAVIMKNEDTLMQTEYKDVESSEENKAVAEQQSVSNISAISAVTQSDTTEVLSGDESVNSLNSKIKRKRKRVRCRKKKTVNEIASLEIPVMPVNIKPLVTQAAPSVHIRFEDIQNKETAEVSSGIVSTEVVAAKINSVEIVNDTVSTDINYEKLCTEEIVKFPVMKNVPPKEGDVIAFKMYVISKSYTPEISNFIIAKVLKCSPENENVSLKLLVGGDQCDIPEGKLYMESCDSGDEDKKDELDFIWPELIEPRLLYP